MLHQDFFPMPHHGETLEKASIYYDKPPILPYQPPFLSILGKSNCPLPPNFMKWEGSGSNYVLIYIVNSVVLKNNLIKVVSYVQIGFNST